MYLREITISGFKSFAEKTKIIFHQPKDHFSITAIVGPNGSGKSNILDAVRWVSGEQSLKTLRIKKGTDVIFAGSKNRAKNNLAEVFLNFSTEKEINQNKAPIEFTEFSIGRKIWRNGENEYLINGKKVRLADILLLLAKINFGVKSFGIIGQGMIDEILKLSPSQRKNFFDEATGIKEFQIKKEEAERKIKKAEINLKEGETVLKELEPRVRSLARQVKKVEKRKEIEKKLNFFQDKYYSFVWQKIQSQSNEIQKKINQQEKIVESLKKEYQKLEEKIEKFFLEENEELIKLKQKREDLNKEKINLQEKRIEILTKIEVEKVKEKKIILDSEKIYEIEKSLKEIKNQQEEIISQSENLSKEKIIIFLKESINRINRLLNFFNLEKESSSQFTDLNNQLININKKIELIQKQLNEYQIKINEIEEQEKNKKQNLYEIQKLSQKKRLKLHQENNYLGEIKMEKARLETKKELLIEEIKHQYPNFNFSQEEKKQIEEIEPEKIKEKIEKLKRNLEIIGQIDPEIEKEYQQCQERYDFLKNQSKDLKLTLKKLNKIKNELEKKIEEKFKISFREINKKFNQYFKLIFAGGEVKLILKKGLQQEEENQFQKNSIQSNERNGNKEEKEIISGIEIEARLPGKKLKHIEALSGGEKSLTALALICAIIDYSSPPLVILDEVDAALDEENSYRFAQILKKLSKNTQFIIITHNRQTMEIADTLYGITMDKNKVSKIISLKLEESIC